jgi:tRNA(fMet)-specific endonuclease VapC
MILRYRFAMGWIAAHATSANLVLVTNNEREFCRVSGLSVENWTI